jgi:hypothetical protein
MKNAFEEVKDRFYINHQLKNKKYYFPEWKIKYIE